MSLGLLLLFLTGGSARPDVLSLLFLRPVAVLLCGVGFVRLDAVSARRYRVLLVIIALIFALTLAQLVVLPHAIWTALPGRDVVQSVDSTTGLAPIARPFSMAPVDTWNAAFSLTIPLAVLLALMRLKAADQRNVLYAIFAAEAVTVVLGMMQAINPLRSALWFYRMTNVGAAVGLFANRNHQAVFLAILYPMLAIYAAARSRYDASGKRRAFIAIACGIAVLPLLLITGSRGGLLAFVIGLSSVPFLYVAPRDVRKWAERRRWKINAPTAALIIVVLLGATSMAMSRAEALRRLFDSSISGDSRVAIWQSVWSDVVRYWPFGSGIGSFVPVYRIGEPLDLLSPEYLNHAHNDYLEVASTAGIPGLLLLGLLAWRVVMLAVAAGRADKRDLAVRYARLGAVIVAMFAVSSIVDYPLRVPSLMALFAIALCWLEGVRTAAREPVPVEGPAKTLS